MGAVLFVASAVVLRGVRLSDARDVLSRSSLWWLGAAAVAATLTTVASGVSLLAVTRGRAMFARRWRPNSPLRSPAASLQVASVESRCAFDS
ncbi:MAG: hypothetical protein R2705_07550 [Ilumatobacteraceae bacterium]